MFTDSFQILSTSLENLTDNQADSIYKKKCHNCKCLINFLQSKGESIINSVINV